MLSERHPDINKGDTFEVCQVNPKGGAKTKHSLVGIDYLKEGHVIPVDKEDAIEDIKEEIHRLQKKVEQIEKSDDSVDNVKPSDFVAIETCEKNQYEPFLIVHNEDYLQPLRAVSLIDGDYWESSDQPWHGGQKDMFKKISIDEAYQLVKEYYNGT
jgi:acetoin utilization deacetylase AcuC-like enzyme